MGDRGTGPVGNGDQDSAVRERHRSPVRGAPPALDASRFPGSARATAGATGVFVQLQHTAEALAEAGRTDRRARRDPGARPGRARTPENLGDVLLTLRLAADQAHALVEHNAPGAVRALHAAPGPALVPADRHETMLAVAELLTEQHDQAVSLNRFHEDGPYDDADDGSGCDCVVRDVKPRQETSGGLGAAPSGRGRPAFGKGQRRGHQRRTPGWEEAPRPGGRAGSAPGRRSAPDHVPSARSRREPSSAVGSPASF